MNITELAVRRPTAIIMGMALILGLGIVGYVNLGADLFPAVNTPVISIHSSYIGAGAEESRQGRDQAHRGRGLRRQRHRHHPLHLRDRVRLHDPAVHDVHRHERRGHRRAEGTGRHGGHAPRGRHPARHDEVRREQPAHPHRLRRGARDARGAVQPGGQDPATTWRACRASATSASRVGQKKQLSITVDKAAMDYYGISATALLGVLQAREPQHPRGGDQAEGARSAGAAGGRVQRTSRTCRNLRVPTPTAEACAWRRSRRWPWTTPIPPRRCA